MKLLTVARDLKRRKARERNTLFVVEGVRATEELLRSRIQSRGAIYTGALIGNERGRRLLEQLRAKVPEVLEVEARDLASAAHTDSPQGVLVVAEVPTRTLRDIELPEKARFLILDGVQDPGNAGTLLRTAAAFGVAATIALPGTVDLWSAKVVRSAMGAHFEHPALHAGTADAIAYIKRHEIDLWGAEAGAPAVGLQAEIPARLALAVGNEGGGLSADIRAQMSRTVGVPIRSEVESLNVSVAAGILLHQLSQ